MSFTIARAVALGALVAPSAFVSAASLSTVAEQSGNRRTGRYEEVERLCPAYQQQWPDAGALRRVRTHARRPTDAGAGRVQRRRARCRSRAIARSAPWR